MVSRPNRPCEAVTRFSCGCFVGTNGGTYCCRRHYDLVKLLHNDKTAYDPPLPADDEGDAR